VENRGRRRALGRRAALAGATGTRTVRMTRRNAARH
jgi:hypothetical protein